MSGTPEAAVGPDAGTAVPNGRERVTVAGGCFWCTEAVFSELRGVEQVVVGYAGGRVPNPTYEQVCTGRTGHAEAIDIAFDPNELGLRDLLRVFFTTHDPTTRDRQGNDVGSQYRSALFYRTPEQKAAMETVLHEIEAAGVWNRPIVTEIVRFSTFYPAEAYHRQYFRRNPEKAYCQLVIAPKVAKLRHQYADRLRRDDPTAPAHTARTTK